MNLPRIMLILGMLFLYVPLAILIIYSFNESRLVTVWSEFSIKWYVELFADTQLINAFLLSLKIAAGSATMAVILGTVTSYILIKFGRFPGHTLFSTLVIAPLVMPEVITGLSLLLLFVGLTELTGWPSSRGAMTIWIAHVTFCVAFVTVVVTARLRDMDASLEEAAMDLGATPLKVFFVITLPLIAPALIAGWLLSFTLSLDDLVIASFVSGPGSSTLPMVIYSSVRLGISPKINALATLFILTVVFSSVLFWWVVNRYQETRSD
ncbi:MAG: putrescine transport system permease protein [Candidatus Azotimanducaceae bacterium]|jgi:putrescine transport system permease protein